VQFLDFDLSNNLFLAPMAGVTDRPFRQLCKRMGAGFAVSEMVTSNALLYGSSKTQRRADHVGETAPISVQIAGGDPGMMAEAARYNVARGAQIIDINMGCPAKKVCNVQAGSALMRDEGLVARILDAVVRAVPNTPVTLKTRTGWDDKARNVLNILKIAENAGIRAIAVHGRTRSQQYTGQAEYETIKAVKTAATIPVIANGDIDSPEKAKAVLEATGVDALMIGRAAQGRPWLFQEIEYFLAKGSRMPSPSALDVFQILQAHLEDLYYFYGEYSGVRIARKHISWYTAGFPNSNGFRQAMYQTDTISAQRQAVTVFFARLLNEAANDEVPLSEQILGERVA
jgi:tRNA-dihydrouridine synthase B